MGNMTESRGALIFIGLPIGNLKDITINALEALKEGKYFYVEDTRSFKSLLDLLEVCKKDKVIDSFHDQSDLSKVESIARLIADGHNVYYCSEAGSPSISDPGVKLLKELKSIKNDVRVTAYSGVSAVLVALESSAVVFSRFMFHGFTPRDKSNQRKLVQYCSRLDSAHIMFESPHRILKFLSFVFESENPPDLIYVCRELTKKFEEIICLKKSEGFFGADKIKPKGEFVVIFKYDQSMVEDESINNDKLLKIANDYIDGDRRPKILSKILSLITNRNSKDIYSKISNKS